jgi:hypothetical protein
MLKRKLVFVALGALVVLMLATTVSASPDAPGAPTLRWVTTSATTAEIRADGITNGGVAGNGAMNWDIYFRFPTNVPSPYPGVSIVPGPLFAAQAPCGFQTNVSMNLPSAPGATGDRGVAINGFCGSGVPNNPVTGNDVLVATVTLAGCPTGLPNGFVMDLDSGDDVFGVSVSQMVDKNLDAYAFQDTDLTDGPAMCSPTAVTMTGFDANNANPAAGGLAAMWPVLAAGAAVAAGGAYALSRRKR